MHECEVSVVTDWRLSLCDRPHHIRQQLVVQIAHCSTEREREREREGGREGGREGEMEGIGVRRQEGESKREHTRSLPLAVACWPHQALHSDH